MNKIQISKVTKQTNKFGFVRIEMELSDEKTRIKFVDPLTL